MKQLVLNSAQLVAAIAELDGQLLPVRTLATWASNGVVVPSVAHPGRRGRYNARMYNLSDLARARLVVHLRQGGAGMSKVKEVLAYCDAELREVFHPRTTAALVFDGRQAHVTRPGGPAVDVPSGQLRLNLKLSQCFEGNEQAAQAARRTA